MLARILAGSASASAEHLLIGHRNGGSVGLGKIDVLVEFGDRDLDRNFREFEHVLAGEGCRRPLFVRLAPREDGQSDSVVLEDNVAAQVSIARYSRSLMIRAVRPEVGLSTPKMTTTPGMI